jgi:AcrR family transcriptional regulator
LFENAPKDFKRLMASPQQRIIHAAGEVFGRLGYKAATVREICKKAKVNVASVNYYFGGKQGLYQKVVLDLMQRTLARYPADAGLGPQASAQEKLLAFVRATLNRLLSTEGLGGQKAKGRLLAREFADPSPVIENMVRDFIGPQLSVLKEITTSLLDSPMPEAVVFRCLFSIVGQCFYYAFASPVVTRLSDMDLAASQTIEALAQHITRFSIGGMAAVRKEQDERL